MASLIQLRGEQVVKTVTDIDADFVESVGENLSSCFMDDFIQTAESAGAAQTFGMPTGSQWNTRYFVADVNPEITQLYLERVMHVGISMRASI